MNTAKYKNVVELIITLGALLLVNGCVSTDSTLSEEVQIKTPLVTSNTCKSEATSLNAQFTTIKALQPNGDLPNDAGVIVHTIHGSGTQPAEMNMKALNQLTVDATKTCGAYLKAGIYLPWCGSNNNPQTGQMADDSSWTYLRHDTLVHGNNIQRADEVVCANGNNKKYGLVFSNHYMNIKNNFGCMYPLDGDTGNRSGRGCGISVNGGINTSHAQGPCPIGMTAKNYESDFQNLLTVNGPRGASYAGSLICSLAKSQFDVWVEGRKNIDLSQTSWPVDEFVLYNWDSYSTNDIANNKFLVGMYYLTGCANDPNGTIVTDGNRKEAQQIADLYKKWSGVDLPVFNLSNSAMRNKSKTPFSCT